MIFEAYNTQTQTTGTYNATKFSYQDYLAIINHGSASISYNGNTYNAYISGTRILIEGPASTIGNMDDVINILNLAGFDSISYDPNSVYNIGSYTESSSFSLLKNSSTSNYSLAYSVNVTAQGNIGTLSASSPGGTVSINGGTSTQYSNYGMMMTAVFFNSVSGNYIYGGVALNATQITINLNNTLNSDTFIEPQVGPGEKGFKPIADFTKSTIGGGSYTSKNPIYQTDTLAQPGEPEESGASVSGTGFLNVYDITKENLANVGACLFGSTLETFLANLLVNPLDYIVSLLIMPYTPHIGGSQTIKIGRWKCSTDTTDGLGTNATGLPLTRQFRTLDFGTLQVPEAWQSFLDYDASSFSLYLPFIGVVDIPVNEVMHGSVNVQYTLDYFTGTCVANVLCTKTLELSNGRSVSQSSQHSYQGNCGIQIPLVNVSYGGMIGSLIQAGAAGLKGDVAGAIGYSFGALKPTVQTKGSISANAGYCAVMQPYITIERPITAEPESYQEVLGYPSYINTTLGSCEDLCICDDIDLKGVVGATDEELDRIRALCREGVYV